MQYLKKHIDDRGVLVPLEFENLPFLPKRIFYVYDVPAGTWRGGHAHKKTEQILICAKGRIKVKLESKKENQELILEEGQSCVVERMVWDSQQFLQDNCVLLVLCSTSFDKDDYITEKSKIYE